MFNNFIQNLVQTKLLSILNKNAQINEINHVSDQNTISHEETNSIESESNN
jgi:hypothetical protein